MYDELKLLFENETQTIEEKDKIIKHVSHNSVLNCLLIITKSNKLFVYDCNTRSFLTKIAWNSLLTATGNSSSETDVTSSTTTTAGGGGGDKPLVSSTLVTPTSTVRVINIQEKCIVLSDKTICSRTAFDGTLLLDSVFQIALNSNLINIDQYRFEIELNLNDAYTLVNVLKTIEIEQINGLDDVIAQLSKELQKQTLFKNDSWNTVKINGAHSTLVSVFTQSLDELKRINLQSLGIPIISSLLDRLYRLDGKYSISLFMQTQTANLQNYDKRLMCSEANRRATFQDWPHMDYKWVLPDSLAQAGFYHQPSQLGVGDDRTICFVCNLCLVAWEQSDQPWSEHERHSPICHFVRGEITENVPLTYTTSTQIPLQVFKNETVACTSDLSSDRYFAVSDLDGHIVVYDTKDLLKEMMHVQLVNDGESKLNKLKIQSLCFYYRNHKHVLYGSFTINDEVFIFSFNIFDIYRSYQSRSNKKSSKSHKTSSKEKSSKTAAAASLPPPPPPSQTTTATAETKAADMTTTTVILKQQESIASPEITTTTATPKILESQISEDTPDEQTPVSMQQQPATETTTSTITDSSAVHQLPPPPPPPPTIKPVFETTTKPIKQQQQQQLIGNTSTTWNTANANSLNNLLFNAFNNIASGNSVVNDNLLFTQAIQQQTAAALQNNCNLCPPSGGFSFTNSNLTPASFNPSLKRQPQISNLSNFLIVRFEICPNNESTSKSKSKYKKSIKISVSAKVLNPTNSNSADDATATTTAVTSSDSLTIPLTQKAFEFTEKCLSFRLACVDLATPTAETQRSNYNVKLINLYDKSLFAIVNFTLTDSTLAYKLYQIKHEENSTTTAVAGSTSTAQQTSRQSSVTTTELVAAPITTPQQPTASVLSATSSSRLNLTELNIANTSPACNIVSLIAISVTTYEDDPDIRLMAMLDHTGLISIVDPFKGAKLCEFSSPSSDEKFISMTYCYGIDKICAISETGKAYMICVRVSPIVNPINLNEIYAIISNESTNDGSITLPKLLVDSPQYKSDVISTLHKLIFFESGKINFSAKFPPCWTPVAPEQHQQRKHPQHMLAEPINYTKSWKYANNCGSSATGTMHDDVLVEIYLNKPIHIGCMQIKLKFNREFTFPYELRLFRQKKTSDASIHAAASSVDSKIDFNLNNKYDVLFGPVDLREYLDASSKRTCVITICSNKLFDTTTNLYFLNLKANRIDSNLDCSNLVDKIFVTLRKYRKTGLPYERIERAVMLTKPTIFKRLLSQLMQSNENDQLKILDLINWIFYNHLTQSNVLTELKEIFLENLEQFIQFSYLNSSRSISKKATLLLTFLLNPNIDQDKKISMQLLNSLIDKLNYLPYFESSASMYWFFMLLHQVMFLDMNKTYDKCLNMLIKLSKANKYNPYYALLKMRFNYTCLPFESKLFDADLYFKFDLNNQKLYQQQQQQQNSGQQQQQQTQQQYQPYMTASNPSYYTQQQTLNANPFALFGFGGFTGFSGFSNLNSSQLINNANNSVNVAGANQLNGNQFHFGFSANNPLTANNLSNNANMNINGSMAIKQDSSNDAYNLMPQVVGLLEVLPLNFKCISSSQGTTIEKTNSKQDLSIYMLPNCNTLLNSTNQLINNINQQPNQNTSGGDMVPQQQLNYNIETYMNKANDLIDDILGMDDAKKTSDGVNVDNALKTTDPLTPKNTPFPGQTPPNEPITQQNIHHSMPTNIDTSIFNSIFSFQSLQLLVIERMEPASRHSVVIDFGFTVALTDIMIPACNELASLSVDIWTSKDQKDSRRLCVSTDINENPILLNDIQPAPVCRYLELIMVALSSNIIKAKIPIGFYFGYPYVFKNELGDEASANNQALQQQHQQQQKANLTSHLSYLEKLYEDCQCHYSMSIGKLCKLLSEIKFPNDNIGHLKMMQFTPNDNADLTNKIKDSYNECLDYQFQLNLNRQMIKRINNLLSNGGNTRSTSINLKQITEDEVNAYIQDISQDQLRIINSLLVKTLLCLTSNVTIQQLQTLKSTSLTLNLDQACSLFHNLCISSNLEKECSWLLLRLCFDEHWWGDFISKLLKNYFILQINEILPLNCIFIILNDICLKSLSYLNTNTCLFKSIFELIISLLKPLDGASDNYGGHNNLEITSLEWLLLFLSRLLSYIDKTRSFLNNANAAATTGEKNGASSEHSTINRWEFLENIYNNNTKTTNTKLSNTLRNQYAQSQQQTGSNMNKSKTKKKPLQTNKYFLFNKLKETRKLNLYDLKYQRKINEKGGQSYFSSNERYLLNQLNERNFSFIQLPRDLTLVLCKLLIKLLINANSYCSSDLFVLTCRILSSLCLNTVPAISLSEIITFSDLNKILLLCVGIEFNHGSVCWGSPWSPHSILCFLMDIIENEKYVVPSSSSSSSEKEQPPPPQQQASTINIDDTTASATSKAKFTLGNFIDATVNTNYSKDSDLISKNFSKLATLFHELQTEDHQQQQQQQSQIQPQPPAQQDDDPFTMMTGFPPPPASIGSTVIKLSGKNKFTTFPNQLQLSSSTNKQHSMSYDLRLDTSIFQTVENYMFLKSCNQIELINRSICEPLPLILLQKQSFSASSSEQQTSTSGGDQAQSISLIQTTIESLFNNLEQINIENLLNFWISLTLFDASDVRFDYTKEPVIQLNDDLIVNLIDYLVKYPYMTIKLWYLVYRTLTLALNQPNTQINLLNKLYNLKNLYNLIYKFISTTNLTTINLLNNTNQELVGDETCQAFIEFLKRLIFLNKTLNLTYNDYHMKSQLFDLLCNSIDNRQSSINNNDYINGCITYSQGSLDAQIYFIEFLIEENITSFYEYNNLQRNEQDSQLVVKYFKNLSNLIKYHLSIYPRLSLKGVNSPRSCFSSVLTSILSGNSYSYQTLFKNMANGDSTKQQQTASSSKHQHASTAAASATTNSKLTSTSQSILSNRDVLICLLLKLAVNLLTHNVYVSTSKNSNSSLNKSKSKISSFNNNNDASSDMNKIQDDYYDDIFTQQMYLYELGLEHDQLDSELEQYTMYDQAQDEFDELSIEENRYKDQSTAAVLKIVPPPPIVQTPQPQQSELLSTNDDSSNSMMIQAPKFNVDDNSIQMKLLSTLSDECLEIYVECLALCQSSALAMVISNTGCPIDISQNDIQTPGDGLYLLLKTMASIVPLKLINASFNYLSKLKRLSEPLLWLLTHLFNNENQLKIFIDKGGLDVISKGLENTTRQLLYSGPCIISSLMNHIDIERQQAKVSNSVDTDSTEGFTNFAPYSTIICTNQTANPVDVLVQTTIPHRRMRSAVWSYQFQPDEYKISLYLTFPYVFLLKEIHILPHTVSFNNCPSYVSIEVSRDGTFMTPVGPPVHTIGMSTIKLQLNKSELVSVVQINLYKSKESQIIGLSQIKLLGYPMFENMVSAKPDMMLTPIEDLVSRSNMGWLRLLYMSLTLVKSLDTYVCEKLTDNTINLCTNLLVSPAMIIYDKIIETILVKLSKFDLKRNLEITKCLLNVEYGFNNGLYSVPHGMLMETIVNIFYQINNDTNNEQDRIKLILEWLVSFASKFNSAKHANQINNILNHSMYKLPSNMLLHCISCIIYNSKSVPIDMITEEYVQTIVQFSVNTNEYYVKQSLDWIICSLLYQKPALISVITSLLDLNDPSRNNIKLIETLSYAVQSKACIQLLIESKFFEIFISNFVNILKTFYNSTASGSHIELKLKQDSSLKIILNFMKILIALADYSDGQEWLGSEQGSQVWKLLINLTCSSSSSINQQQQGQQCLDNAIQHSEELCLLIIQLIKKMLFCNQTNQNLFSRYITQLIKDLSFNYGATNSVLGPVPTTTISGFLHQLILQIFLEDQTVTVNYIRKSDYFKSQCNSSLGLLTHPRYGTGNNNRTIELPLSKTCSQLVHLISDMPITASQFFSAQQQQQQTQASTSSNHQQQQLVNDLSDNIQEMSDLLSKLKTNFESISNNAAKSLTAANATGAKGNASSNFQYPKLKLFSKELSNEKYIPSDCTLAHIVNAYLNKTNEKTVHNLTLFVKLISGSFDDHLEYKELYQLNEQQEALHENTVTQTPLDAFVKCDGLVVLAERLPLVMPFIHEPLLNITDKDRMPSGGLSGASGGGGGGGNSTANNDNPKTSSDFVEYVIMNESDEPFDDDIYGEIPLNTNQQTNMNKIKKIAMPPHAFIAFGIFLKIPGYATILLRNKRQAQCILKLLLGANRNKDDEFGISLSTMPFNSLRELLNDKKLQAPAKLDIARFMVENRILTVILSILSTLSHHQHRQTYPHFIHKILPDSSDASGSDADQGNAGAGGTATTLQQQQQQQQQQQAAAANKNANNLYWAKGTGFGTGSTIQQWDAERTMMQQKMEEEHVTCIMQILASYIRCFSENEMSEAVIELFDHSCVINALASYLRNDSVLDMSRHVPLYRSSLELLQSFVRSVPLRGLVEKCNLFDLLKNMKHLVDSYTSKIKLADEEGGLTCLVPVLEETYSLLSNVIKPVEKKEKEAPQSSSSALSIEKFYCDTMKELQFDSFAIVSDASGAIKALVPYYYESSLNDMSNLNNSNRAKRLAQETVTLSNSLPLSYSSSVFVRCDEERLDVMKVLITGPQDTPYSNGCFEFDVFFPSDYPDSPPLVNLQTTGNQTVRFNPNLYHDGKVCLSILNTWHGRPEERWNAQTSSFLQVLVSIQSLILVSEPYFNEPGYERSRGTPAGTASSIEHDANIRQATVKWGMLESIKKPNPCFKDIIRKHFYLKRKEIKFQCETWSKELELHVNDKQIGQSVSKSLLALRRHMGQLYEELDKLEVSENVKISTISEEMTPTITTTTTTACKNNDDEEGGEEEGKCD